MRVPSTPLRRRWSALVAVAGGIVGMLAFPRYGIWPLAVVSVGLLSVAVDGHRARTGGWIGYLYGLAFMLPLLSWTGIYVGPVPWVILCVGMAAFFAVLGAVLTAVQRLPWAPAWVGAAWVLEEALRDRIPFGGFPWGRLAFSQADSPLRWFAPLGGMPLLTFVVAVIGGGLFVAYRVAAGRGDAADARRVTLRALAAPLAVVIGVPLLGALLSWPLGPSDAPRTLRVALIQGGLPESGLAFEQRARQVLDNHVAETLKLAAEVRAGTQPRPDLVLWPENSSDVDPITDPVARADVDRAVKAIDTPILVGAIRSTANGKYRLNEGILWSPTTGPGAPYIKRHPVPFAEYIPLRGIAEAVSSDAKLVTNDMVAGSGDGLLRGGPVLLGDVICFEVAYDSLVQSSVAAGAQVLVVQTNNATFGHTAETYQQLAMSRLRAVETDRTVLQVATTGKSAVINPDGSVAAETGALYHAAILTADIAPRTGTTLAVRLGAVPEFILAGLALVGVGTIWYLGRRRRPVPAPQSVPRRQEEMVET